MNKKQPILSYSTECERKISFASQDEQKVFEVTLALESDEEIRTFGSEARCAYNCSAQPKLKMYITNHSGHFPVPGDRTGYNIWAGWVCSSHKKVLIQEARENIWTVL